MKRLLQKAKRSQMRALILSALVCAVYLSAVVRMGNLPRGVESDISLNGSYLILSRLTLTDSAVGRLNKRSVSFEGKSHRRQMTIASLPACSNISPLVALMQGLSVFRRDESFTVIFISPPENRAPPQSVI